MGTTNKTHLRDYERAISDRTAAILRVHPSNYKIVGFTAEVPLEDLVRLGRDRGVTVIDDVGAGPLIDFTQFGFEKEPTLAESVAAGADLVTSSADKMIGGPQARDHSRQGGVGSRPSARIRWPASSAWTSSRWPRWRPRWSLFLDQQRALGEVPTLRMLRRDLADIESQAERIAAAIRAARARRPRPRSSTGFSQMGSGSLPGQDLPTRLVAVAAEASRRGRNRPPPAAARPAGLRPRRTRARCWSIPARCWTARRPCSSPRSAPP